jgi:hypothetical protein
VSELSGLRLSLNYLQALGSYSLSSYSYPTPCMSRLAKKLPIGDLKTIAAELEVAAAEQSRSTLQQGLDDEDLS